MTAATDTAKPLPFSKYEGSAREFMDTLAYETDEAGFATSRGMRRQQGDSLFLSLLGDQTLGEVREDELRKALDRAEEHLPGAWSVYGHEDEAIRDRLDRHFARAQSLRVQRNQQRVQRFEQAQRDQDRWHVAHLRDGIVSARQHVKEIEAQIAAMETELAAVAQRLGVRAWP